MMFILLLALVGCAVNAQGNLIPQNKTNGPDDPRDESVFDAEGYSVCSALGGRHIITFDGSYYHFPGKGTYTLFQDCQTTDPNFQVLINQTYYCDSKQTKCDISLKISNYGFIIQILPGGIVLQNNKRIRMPFQNGELELRKIANYIVIKGIKGVVILFDGSSSVYTFASPEIMGQLCGLCGFFDGKKTNDFVNYVKKLINNLFDFSNAWLDPTEQRTIPGVEEDKIHPCLKLRNSNPKRANHVQTTCSILKADYVPFQKCHSAVDPDAFLAMCNRDMCSCLLSKGVEECNHLSCDVAQQYARACNKQSVHINWRSNTYCSPPKCPLNMEFKECSRNCQRSCGTDSFETECEEFCVDGCFCKNGTLWDYATSSCVLRSLCSCYQADNSVAFPPGTSLDVGCETCFCGEAGRWNCIKNGDCPGVCSLSGDPHFKTFDERQFFFEGECEYVLSQFNGKETDMDFAVWIENKYCNQITDGVCTKVITLKLGKGEKQIIFRLRGFTVEVDGFPIGIPYQDESVVIRKVSSILIRLTTMTGVDIIWDGRTRIYLTLASKFQGKVAGMCGNFNLDVNDDNLTPNGENEFNVTKFALEWKTNTVCNSNPSTGYLGACALSKEYENLAQRICSRFWTEDAIRNCNSKVNPSKFVDQCKHDVCMCGRRHGDPRDCECAAFASYARECALRGYIFEWRKSGFCEINCPKGMVYQECGPNCDQNCRRIQPDNCDEECIEGCNCPQGKRFDEEAEKCVPVSKCKCYYQGNYYESNEIRKEISRECVCSGGTWDCKDLDFKDDDQNVDPASDANASSTQQCHRL